MSRKTITVEEETWRKLTKAKFKLNCETLGDVIDKLFLLVTKFKMAEELKELK